MKKELILAILFALAVPLIFMANNCSAKSSYGNNVDGFCLDSNPFSGDCLLCHTASSKGDPHPGKDAYLAGDNCYFCPDDSNCGSGPVDADNDGYDETVDCNDNVAAINPGATEDCTDGIDNDCDNLVDAQDPDATGCPVTCTDNDNDTYSVEGGQCGQADCNDSDAFVNPGEVESCTDGIDNDCDNLADCADSDCSGDSSCQSGSICADYLDRGTCKQDPTCAWNGKLKVCQDGGGSGGSCSDYSDRTSCQDNGCSWSGKDKSCS